MFYGVKYDNEETALKYFHDVTNEIKSFPPFRGNGIVADVERNGVDGGLMNMVWTEISFKCSKEHTAVVDRCRELFPGGETYQPNCWRPHLSLGYDNPNEGCKMNMSTLAASVAAVEAKGENVFQEREIDGFALVDMNGDISEWRVIEEIMF